MTLAETFEQMGLKEIDEFVRIGQEEHLHLDFKTIKNANLQYPEDKCNLAKSISGFANSSGGIIVWGVDARKNDHGIDCASTKTEIAQIKLFLSRLNSLTGECVSPIVDGIRHKALELSSQAGFAITLIPENDSGPYMAKLGEDRYYKRSGDSFYRMEHFDLEDMFGRRQKPRLKVNLNVTPILNEPGIEEITFSMENEGRAMAKYFGLTAEFQGAEIIQAYLGLQNLSLLNPGLAVVGYSNSSDAIHPNSIALRIGAVRYKRISPTEKLRIHVRHYCENSRTEIYTVELSPVQFAIENSQHSD
jgi:hypothetical protein